MRVRSLLASIALATFVTASHAGSFVKEGSCPKNMSCKLAGLESSQRPRPMSVPDSPAPWVCVRNVMGEVYGDTVKICEDFIASGKGTARERATALVNLGHHYFYKKDKLEIPKHALKTWKEASAVDPTFAEPLILQGNAAANAGDHETAYQLFKRAAKLDPKNWRAPGGAALMYLSWGWLDEAAEYAKEAVEIAPDAVGAHVIYGDILRRARKIDEALAEYRKAAERYQYGMAVVPGYLQWYGPWSRIATLEMERGHPLAAIEAASHEIDDAPDGMPAPAALVARADYYEAAGRKLDAAADLERAMLTYGPESDLYFKYRMRAATLRASIGDGEAAKAVFHELLKSGKLRNVLRVQVFLKNKGFSEVDIDGKVTVNLEKALGRCLESKDCISAFGQPI